MQLSGHLTTPPLLLYFWQSAFTRSEISSSSAEYYLLIYLVSVPRMKQSTESKVLGVWSHATV
jgi:hypothetical protein